MKTIEEIKEIINHITYKKGWEILLTLEDGERPVIQIVFDGEDEKTGIVEKQKCRKWFLSYHMTTTEIVYTVLKAIQAAEDHETREFFKYCNVRIANPHFSVDQIVDLVNGDRLREDVR
jgi:hypothetical protein